MTLVRFSISTILILLCVLLAPTVFAQVQPPPAHPATIPNCSLAPIPTDPFSTVNGTSWVFHWEGAEGLYAAVGNMTFFTVTDPKAQLGKDGFINVIETRNLNSSIYRFLNYNGRFEIYSDCTGGVLMFNSGAAGSQEFDFYFRESMLNGEPFGSLVMVDIDSKGGYVLHGEAEKQGI